MGNLYWHNALQYLGILYSEKEETHLDRRRNIFYTRVLLFSGTVTILALVKGLMGTPQWLTVIPFLVFIIFITTSYWLIKSKNFKASKLLFLFGLNLFILTMCSLVSKEKLTFVYFYPLIAIAYVIFDDSDHRWKVVCIVLPSVLMIILAIFDFKLFGNIQFATSDVGSYTMIINIVASVVVIAVCIDFLIKNNRTSEKLLRNMARDIQKKNEDLEKTNTELDRFVYSTSHDLRAPLLSIQGLVNVALAESTQDSAAKEYLIRIGDRTKKLDGFIQEIIDYARNARTELRPEPTNLKELIEEVIKNLEYLEGADKIKFSITVLPNELVFLDKNRIKNVLSNLISNAIKYRNVNTNGMWIRVSVTNEKELSRISISDNGIGIKPELQTKVFEMFYRATDKSTGSGLGLYIVKEILNKMNGHISITSEYGKGSNFVITLPVRYES